MSGDLEEKVVMTPKSKTSTSTTLVVERKAVPTSSAEDSNLVHVAGGDHTGLIINKAQVYENGVSEPCHCQLEFRVYLVRGGAANEGKDKQGANTPLSESGEVQGTNAPLSREARCLRFWFKPQTPPAERTHHAMLFFKDLVTPEDFPRDYVGFIKKIMKLMQGGYEQLKTLEVELRQEPDHLHPGVGMDVGAIGGEAGRRGGAISERRVLELIENAYPSPLSLDLLAEDGAWSAGEVSSCLQALERRGLACAVGEGLYLRQHSEQAQRVRVVPALPAPLQPRLAIVTALYAEKLAVDAMMQDAETYVRYGRSDGASSEGSVYTVGAMGGVRVVSTKLGGAALGRGREAHTAAGGALTRLLGVFQRVEVVLLVGVAGGVPHYTDYTRHPRLGDVVMSAPDDDQDSSVYVALEAGARNEAGGWDLQVRPYAPAAPLAQHAARQLAADPAKPYLRYVQQAESVLEEAGEAQWARPDDATDRLTLPVGAGAFLEVAHPTPTHTAKGSEMNGSAEGFRVHCGRVCGLGGAGAGAGAGAEGEEAAAGAALAARAHALAVDTLPPAVLDSIIGNRKDAFICVRGVCDYGSGCGGGAWQSRAALHAAAVARALVPLLAAQLPATPSHHAAPPAPPS